MSAGHNVFMIRATVWNLVLGAALLASGCAQMEPAAGRAADNARGVFGEIWKSGKGRSQPEQPDRPAEARVEPSRPAPPTRAKTPKASRPAKKTGPTADDEENSLGGAERPGGM